MGAFRCGELRGELSWAFSRILEGRPAARAFTAVAGSWIPPTDVPRGSAAAWARRKASFAALVIGVGITLVVEVPVKRVGNSFR